MKIWNHLSKKEKDHALAIGAVLFVLLIYILIWLPLSHKATALHNELLQQQKLLSWMKSADARLKMAGKNNFHPEKNKKLLLSDLQKQLDLNTLTKNITQLHQVDANSAILDFKKIDFDRLMTWLTQMIIQHSLIIKQMTIQTSEVSGFVTAHLLITAPVPAPP